MKRILSLTALLALAACGGRDRSATDTMGIGATGAPAATPAPAPMDTAAGASAAPMGAGASAGATGMSKGATAGATGAAKSSGS